MTQNEEDVRQLFYSVKPGAGTPTGARLEQILSQYITRIEAANTKSGGGDPVQSDIKPLNLIVITDGEPTDDPESVIIAAAKRLDAGRFSLTQVGIQFIQVGNDKKASKALHELDNHLSESGDVRVSSLDWPCSFKSNILGIVGHCGHSSLQEQAHLRIAHCHVARWHQQTYRPHQETRAEEVTSSVCSPILIGLILWITVVVYADRDLFAHHARHVFLPVSLFLSGVQYWPNRMLNYRQ